MGGRGGYSNVNSSSKTLKSIENTIKSTDWWQDTEKYTLNPEKLLNSPTFMSVVKDDISKQAFLRDYEITISEVDKMANKLIEDLIKKKKRGH